MKNKKEKRFLTKKVEENYGFILICFILICFLLLFGVLIHLDFQKNELEDQILNLTNQLNSTHKYDQGFLDGATYISLTLSIKEEFCNSYGGKLIPEHNICKIGNGTQCYVVEGTHTPLICMDHEAREEDRKDLLGDASFSLIKIE